MNNVYEKIINRIINDSPAISEQERRVKHAMLAGWTAIVVSMGLFSVKIVLGLQSGSIAIMANAFHLLSHLANSVVLVFSFWIASRPATKETPFGHGRMELVAPLIMAVLLFISGIEIAREALHQLVTPHELHYWPALPWILGVTVLIKWVTGSFNAHLGKRIGSTAVKANALHQRIEAGISCSVILSLILTREFQVPQIDGFVGLGAALWILYLGWDHVREAVVPLLGTAPSRELQNSIRQTALSTEGVEGAHEIIVHDYGAKYLITLHVEIPENLPPAETHDIAERCEDKLREKFGGEIVCHTDPLMERTQEVKKVEAQFQKALDNFTEILEYHDFRIVSKSSETIIIVADLDASEDVSEDEFPNIEKQIEEKLHEHVPDLAYACLRITPPYSY